MNKVGIAGCVAAMGALLVCGIYLWVQPPPQPTPITPPKTGSDPVAPAVGQTPNPAAPGDAQSPAPTERGGNRGNGPAGRGGRGAIAAADGAGRLRPGNDPAAMQRDRGMFPGRDVMAESLASLAVASLGPDFDLTNEQREKIQAISTEAKAAGKWQTAHADELAKLDEDLRNAREDGEREQVELLTQKRQDLMVNAPKSEDAVTKLKAVLTPEQLKAMEAVAMEKRSADDQRRQRGGGMFGGGRGGMGGNEPRP